MNKFFAVLICIPAFLPASSFANEETAPSFQSWRFCAEGDPRPPKNGSVKSLENKARRRIFEIFKLSTKSIKIESRSPDWENESKAKERILEILNSRPGTMTSMIIWAEGVTYGIGNITAKVGKARIETASYHVCIKDSDGSFWFFRTVPAAGWSK